MTLRGNVGMVGESIYTTVGKSARLHKWYLECICYQRYYIKSMKICFYYTLHYLTYLITRLSMPHALMGGRSMYHTFSIGCICSYYCSS